MKIKRLFPFSIAEYLQIFACYVLLMLSFYFSVNLIMQRSRAFQFLDIAAAEQSAVAAYSLLGLFLAMLALVFLVYTFLSSVMYTKVLNKKLSLLLWPKFMLSSVIIFLIFLIPVLFVLRLLSERNPFSSLAFMIVLVLIIHFSNLIYLFTASERKVFLAIKKGFEFGTFRIGELIPPYLIIAIVFIALSFAMRIITVDFLNLILSFIILTWALLFVGRTIFPLKKISRRRT